MATLSTANLMSVLQLTGTANTTLVNNILPFTLNWCLDYINNYFHVIDDEAGILEDDSISFDGDNNTIDHVEAQFLAEGFVSDAYVHVQNSKKNDGVYLVQTAAAGSLTLASGWTVETEAADNAIVVTRVDFPKGFVIPFALLIKSDLQTRDPNIKGRTLGRRSETYVESAGLYPQGVLRRFLPFRKERWG